MKTLKQLKKVCSLYDKQVICLEGQIDSIDKRLAAVERHFRDFGLRATKPVATPPSVQFVTADSQRFSKIFVKHDPPFHAPRPDFRLRATTASLVPELLAFVAKMAGQSRDVISGALLEESQALLACIAKAQGKEAPNA